MINVADRTWNDNSIAATLDIKLLPVSCSYRYACIHAFFLQKQYNGQTFCIRVMFTAFMSDASNIMSFYGEKDMNDAAGHAFELWMFQPQKSGQQVIKLSFFKLIFYFLQFAMVVMEIENTFQPTNRNTFNNFLVMKEIILPLEWHSFCLSIDPVTNIVKLYHNDHIQAKLDFKFEETDNQEIFKFMTKGHLGGPKFVGLIADFQIFGTVLPEEAVLAWTGCQTRVRSGENQNVSYLCIHFTDIWRLVFLNNGTRQNNASSTK